MSNLKLVVENLIERIKHGKAAIKNRELIDLCQPYVGPLFGIGIDPHIYHEIAESSLNLLIKQQYAESNEAKNEPKRFVTEILKPMVAMLPTQTWRSYDLTIRQQFSTPPPVAFLLSYLVKGGEGEILLEPSAGTGNLVAWSNSRIFANEINKRRRELLGILGISATSFDAEFIDDYLPQEVSPDCLLMNPPFSSNGGRTERNSNRFGFRHVESALKRLNKGGKFGIILGEAGGIDTKTGNDLWRKLSGTIETKAIIKLNGREFYKNGTTVDINLFIGKKLKEPQKIDWNQASQKINCITAETTEEAFEKALNLDLRLNK